MLLTSGRKPRRERAISQRRVYPPRPQYHLTDIVMRLFRWVSGAQDDAAIPAVVPRHFGHTTPIPPSTTIEAQSVGSWPLMGYGLRVWPSAQSPTGKVQRRTIGNRLEDSDPWCKCRRYRAGPAGNAMTTLDAFVMRHGQGRRGQQRRCDWKPEVGHRCSRGACAQCLRTDRAGERSEYWSVLPRSGSAGPIDEG